MAEWSGWELDRHWAGGLKHVAMWGPVLRKALSPGAHDEGSDD